METTTTATERFAMCMAEAGFPVNIAYTDPEFGPGWYHSPDCCGRARVVGSAVVIHHPCPKNRRRSAARGRAAGCVRLRVGLATAPQAEQCSGPLVLIEGEPAFWRAVYRAGILAGGPLVPQSWCIEHYSERRAAGLGITGEEACPCHR